MRHRGLIGATGSQYAGSGVPAVATVLAGEELGQT